jgi:hypothetical protein
VIEDGDLLTAAEVSELLKVGRNFPYIQLRTQAIVISVGVRRRPTLRWSRQRLEEWLAQAQDSGNKCRYVECSDPSDLLQVSP